jgi:DNA-binding response OmpR family regulator
MAEKILIIEDDDSIATLTRLQLESRSFLVQIARNGAEGLRQAYAWQPDLVLLDIMMPDMMAGRCAAAARNERQPIIFVMARAGAQHRAACVGADDYIIKPFSTKELQARIEAVLRRHRQTDSSDLPLHYTNGWLSVDTEQRQVMVEAKPVDLSPIEFRLLTTLVRNEGKVLTHEYLLECGGPAWDERHYDCMWDLRQIGRMNHPQYILTERGVLSVLQRASDRLESTNHERANGRSRSPGLLLG